MGSSPSDDTSMKSPAAARSSRVPTERLSTTLTAWPPSSIRDRIRAVPIKPQPPVTSQFTRTAPGRDHLPSFLYLRACPSLPRVVCRAYLRPTSSSGASLGANEGLKGPSRELPAEEGAIRYNLRRLVRCSREGLVDGRKTLLALQKYAGPGGREKPEALACPWMPGGEG